MVIRMESGDPEISRVEALPLVPSSFFNMKPPSTKVISPTITYSVVEFEELGRVELLLYLTAGGFFEGVCATFCFARLN